MLNEIGGDLQFADYFVTEYCVYFMIQGTEKKTMLILNSNVFQNLIGLSSIVYWL